MRWLSLRLAIARVRKDATFFLTATFAVLLAFLSLFSLDAISSSRESAIANYVLDSTPAGDRTLTASSSRLISDVKEFQKASEFLKTNSKGVTTGSFTPLVLLHQLADSHGVGFYLGSLNNIQRQVRVVSGRLPGMCTQTLCEVIQIGASRETPLPQALGVVIVGKGKLIHNTLFSGTYSLDSGVPLLLSEGIGSLNNLRKAETLQGTNGWVANLDRSVIEKNGIETLIERTVGLENRADLFTPSLTFTWPQESLTEASESAQLLRTKINSISHSIEILLFFFLIILAGKRRTSHQQFRSGLSRLGTPSTILTKEIGLEFSGPILVGASLAMLFFPILALTLQHAGLHASVSQTLIHAFVYLPFLLALLFLLPGVALYGDISWGRRVWIPIGLAAVSLGVFLRVIPDSTFNDWKAPLFGAFTSIFISWLAILLFGWATRKRRQTVFILLKESASTWRSVAAVLSFAIFLVSLSLAFSSGVNREIELQSSEEVPLSLKISVGSTLKTPLGLGSVDDYAKVVKGSLAYPILRSSASVRTKESISDSLQVLGVPLEALRHIAPAAAKALAPSQDTVDFNPPAVPLGSSKKLTINLTNIPSEVDVIAWFETPFGAHTSAKFKGKGSIRTIAVGNVIPTNSTLVAFELQESSDYVSRRLHAQGEGDFQVPVLTGVGSITSLLIDQEEILLSESGWGVSNFRYAFNGDSLYLHPSWPMSIPSVIADPETANLAADGILTLSGLNGMSFRAKVIAVQSSFPSAGDRFLVLNLAALQAQMAQESLGIIDPIELWIKTSNSDKYLETFKASKFRELDIQSHQEISDRLRANPSITGLKNGYAVAVGFAGILALIFLISSLPLLRREKTSLLHLLEAEGVGPRKLRRGIRTSLSGTVLFGVGIGTVSGVVGASLFLARTAPLNQLGVIALLTIGVTEIGSRIYLQRCFRDEDSVEVKDGN